MVCRGDVYMACPCQCGLVVNCANLHQHVDTCDGKLGKRTRKASYKRKQTEDYAASRASFLADAAERFHGRFKIACHCTGKCSFKQDEAVEKHFQAEALGAAEEKKVCDFLKKKKEELEKQLRERKERVSFRNKELQEAVEKHSQAEALGAAAEKEVCDLNKKKEELEGQVGFRNKELQEAHENLNAAKVVSGNYQLLLTELLEVNKTLAEQINCLKREQTRPPCVICRDAKPSKALVPCGHVCVCSTCWNRLAASRPTSGLPDVSQRGPVRIQCLHLNLNELHSLVPLAMPELGSQCGQCLTWTSPSSAPR